jgi:protein-S-isoprenylcysteine O-methyltransferase Ste14
MALLEEFEKQGLWLFKHRSLLPLSIFFIATGLYLRTEIYPETFILENTPYEIYYESGCLLFSLIGLAIRILTTGYTIKNTSGRNVEGHIADSINTTGTYSIVRHPLYLGNFFMWMGPALLTGNFWFVISFCLFYWIYYERIMFAEEHFLRTKFGNIYTDWAKNVPAFIPRFRNFVKPKIYFSWRKVLRDEKNGLAAMFCIFCGFDILGEIIQKGTNFNYFLIVCCILTLLLYVVLKILKKRTTLLNEEGR